MGTKTKAAEKPRPRGWRFYDRHKKLAEDRAKKDNVSEAEVVRRAIEAYCVKTL